MDLKTLLNDNNWSSSELNFDADSISKEITEKSQKPIQFVLNNAKKSILMNSIFLVAFFIFYLFFTNTITTIAIAIIAAVYLFTILSLVIGLINLEKPNLNQNIKDALKDIIRFDEAINRFQCKNYSLIISTSFIGGFLLGLGTQGYTISKLLDKWGLILFLIVGAVGIFYWSKTKSFKSFNRSFNPNYFKSKAFLKEQLQILNNQ